MQIITIIYRLAVAFWVGGVAIFTFVLTPILFKTQARDLAGTIVGVLFPGYFRWGLACGIRDDPLGGHRKVGEGDQVRGHQG